MMDLRTRISPVIEAVPEPTQDAEEDTRDPSLIRIEALLDQGEHAEAFFLARRELASGTAWAQDVLDRARAGMEERS
jgi:hypothetical protein